VFVSLFKGKRPNIPPLTISTPGIKKLLNNINPHKATGPDNISGRVLKELQEKTAPILSLIFEVHRGFCCFLGGS
jgi:hypothetical protein